MVRSSNSDVAESEAKIAAAIRAILKHLGEDSERKDLRRTPERATHALQFFTRSYTMSLEATVGDAIFTTDHSDIVLVRDIDISSLCEHHLLPFLGKIHIAYVLRGRIIGLSKLARIVEIYARRLQIQERLTREVAESIQLVLRPEGVAVVMECLHTCMVMRRVRQAGATTVTKTKTGVFATDRRVDEQFHDLLGMSR